MARQSGSPISLATHSRSSSIGPPSPRRQKRASSPTSSYASGSPQFAGRDSLRSDSSQSGSLSTHDAPHPDLESPIIPIALRGENAPKLSIETSSTVNDEVHQALNFIKHFCKRRGETAEVWVGKVRSELMAADGQHIDFHDTLTMLHRVLERLQKGEFLCFYNPSSQLVDRFNPNFSPSKIVVQGKRKGAGSPPAWIVESNRMLPLNLARLDLILDKKIYDDALVNPTAALTKKAFDAAVFEISNTFMSLWHQPGTEDVAMTWEEGVQDYLGEKPDSLLRWFLIVAAEKVRRGEKLPDPGPLWDNVVNVPHNIGPSDSCLVCPVPEVHHFQPHSLGRISIRQARRIGFVGRESLEGGYDF